ncbi:hypothetical protein GCM10027063_29620 [Promicromonospora xylanilytica]
MQGERPAARYLRYALHDGRRPQGDPPVFPLPYLILAWCRTVVAGARKDAVPGVHATEVLECG